ncbi:MAG: hypothetical protein ABIS08_10805 [Pseudolysinimonas sp.]
MKRITYAGGSLVTGNAIAAALLEYTASAADTENSVTVDIPVLEGNGETSVHTLLLSPAGQFDVSDVGGTEADEEQRFPVPELPQVGIHGRVDRGGAASQNAEDLNDVMQEIDEGLGQ